MGCIRMIYVLRVVFLFFSVVMVVGRLMVVANVNHFLRFVM